MGANRVEGAVIVVVGRNCGQWKWVGGEKNLANKPFNQLEGVQTDGIQKRERPIRQLCRRGGAAGLNWRIIGSDREQENRSRDPTGFTREFDKGCSHGRSSARDRGE